MGSTPRVAMSQKKVPPPQQTKMLFNSLYRTGKWWRLHSWDWCTKRGFKQVTRPSTWKDTMTPLQVLTPEVLWRLTSVNATRWQRRHKTLPSLMSCSYQTGTPPSVLRTLCKLQRRMWMLRCEQTSERAWRKVGRQITRLTSKATLMEVLAWLHKILPSMARLSRIFPDASVCYVSTSSQSSVV